MDLSNLLSLLRRTLSSSVDLSARGVQRLGHSARRSVAVFGHSLAGEPMQHQEEAAAEAAERAAEALQDARNQLHQSTAQTQRRLRLHLHQQQELAQTELTQQPKIARAERLVQGREAAVANASAAYLAAPPHASAAARTALERAQKKLARAQRRLQTAQRPLRRAQRRERQAAASLRQSQEHLERTRSRLHRANRRYAHEQQEHEEYQRPRFRPHRGLTTLAQQMAFRSDAAAGAIQSGGPLGGAVSSIGHLGAGIAQGAAMAFGGPFGPALAKGIDMLEKFAGFGFKAAMSLDQWVKASDEQRLALSKDSPHMGMVKRIKEMNEFLNNALKGRHLAPGEATVEEVRNDLRQSAREVEHMEGVHGQMLSAAWKQAQTRVNIASDIHREQALQKDRNKFTSFLQYWGGQALHLPGINQVASALVLPAVMYNPTERERDQIQRITRQGIDEYQQLQQERGRNVSFDPDDPNGHFVHLRGAGGEMSPGEDLARRSARWAEQFGRPARHAP